MAKRKVFGLFYVKEGVVNGSIINFISIKYEGEGRGAEKFRRRQRQVSIIYYFYK